MPFFVAEPDDLPESETYAKEKHLIEDIREELSQGRRCQVYATLTGKHDVTGKLQGVLEHAGFVWPFFGPRSRPTVAKPGTKDNCAPASRL